MLYLALEDGYERLQRRMYRMFGVEGTKKLHFAICAKQLGNGLDAQLEKFVREHPDTRLIIIDTLQKVREPSGEAYSYRDDYQIIGQLKQFADKFGLCCSSSTTRASPRQTTSVTASPTRQASTAVPTARSC